MSHLHRRLTQIDSCIYSSSASQPYISCVCIRGPYNRRRVNVCLLFHPGGGGAGCTPRSMMTISHRDRGPCVCPVNGMCRVLGGCVICGPVGKRSWVYISRCAYPGPRRFGREVRLIRRRPQMEDAARLCSILRLSILVPVDEALNGRFLVEV